MRQRGKTPEEVAGIIERFLEGKSLYPQEWNDFVDCSQPDPAMEKYRKRCDKLDPQVNSPASPFVSPAQIAIAENELRRMAAELRAMIRDSD